MGKEHTFVKIERFLSEVSIRSLASRRDQVDVSVNSDDVKYVPLIFPLLVTARHTESVLDRL